MLRYGLKNGILVGDVPDRPLTQPGARQPKQITPRFMDVIHQLHLHLVVREERHVAGMRDRQQIPVLYDVRPWGEQSRENVKLEYRYVLVHSEIDRCF